MTNLAPPTRHRCPILSYSDNYQGANREELIGGLSGLGFLVLDDLGSPTRETAYSEDHIEILLQVLNHRQAHNLPTVITTNLKLNQIAVQFGPRIHSRIMGLCAVAVMQGEDFRVKAVGL